MESTRNCMKTYQPPHEGYPPPKPFDCNATGFSFDCQPPNIPSTGMRVLVQSSSNIPKASTPEGKSAALKGSGIDSALTTVCSVKGKKTLSYANACRICHEDDDVEDLIAPCYCAGTMGLIHRSCMQKWLTTSKTTACELCKCQIHLRSRARGVFQWFRWTFDEWNAERERHRRVADESDTDGRHLLGDAICFLFLTPMALTSAGLCAESAIAKQEQPWEAAGLTMLTIFLVAIYFIWISMSIRFHLTQFRTWQDVNLEYFIAATPYPPQGCRVKSRLKGKVSMDKIKNIGTC